MNLSFLKPTGLFVSHALSGAFKAFTMIEPFVARLAILQLYMEIGDMATRQALHGLEGNVHTLTNSVQRLRTKDEIEKRNVRTQVDEIMQGYMAKFRTLYDDKVHDFERHARHFISLEKREIEELKDFCLKQLDDQSIQDKQEALDTKLKAHLSTMERSEREHLESLRSNIEQSERRIRDFEAESNARIKVELAKLNEKIGVHQF